MDIPIIISSDAHHISELNKGFNFALEILKKASYKEYYVFNKNIWKAQFLDFL